MKEQTADDTINNLDISDDRALCQLSENLNFNQQQRNWRKLSQKYNEIRDCSTLNEVADNKDSCMFDSKLECRECFEINERNSTSEQSSSNNSNNSKPNLCCLDESGDLYTKKSVPIENEIEIRKEQKSQKSLNNYEKPINLIEEFKQFTIEQDIKLNSKDKYKNSLTKTQNDHKINDEICELMVKLNLDLMIEYPPLALMELIDQCHSMNREIHLLLIQNIVKFSNGSKIVDLSPNSMDLLCCFVQTLLNSSINFPVIIGNSIDSLETKFLFAQTINNLYNVYYIDSRLIELFYFNIISQGLFGGCSPLINIKEIINKNTICCEKLGNSFLSILLFSYFQDEESTKYALDNLSNNKNNENNCEINIFSVSQSIPSRVSIFSIKMFKYLNQQIIKLSSDKLLNEEIKIIVNLIIFNVLLHSFWIPYSIKLNSKHLELFKQISDAIQSATISELNLKISIEPICGWGLG